MILRLQEIEGRGYGSDDGAELLSVPVGEAMLGRVVTPLGQPLDGGAAIQTSDRRKVDMLIAGHCGSSAGETAVADGGQGD